MSTLESSEAVFDIPTLITVEQLAKIVQKSVRSVWRMRSAGQVPAPINVGGGVRWRVDDIKRWIEDGCPAAGARK